MVNSKFSSFFEPALLHSQVSGGACCTLKQSYEGNGRRRQKLDAAFDAPALHIQQRVLKSTPDHKVCRARNCRPSRTPFSSGRQTMHTGGKNKEDVHIKTQLEDGSRLSTH